MNIVQIVVNYIALAVALTIDQSKPRKSLGPLGSYVNATVTAQKVDATVKIRKNLARYRNQKNY